MFKEERILCWSSLGLLFVLSLSRLIGLKLFLDKILDTLGIHNPFVARFLLDLFQVESTIFTDGLARPAAFAGFGFCLLIVLTLLLIRKPGYKKLTIAGVILVSSGFLEMVLLDISVVGWLAGPMMMIAGFLLYRKRRLYI